MRFAQWDAATEIEDLRQPPFNRLEALSGNRAGQWSIRINDQWRMCFRFEHGAAQHTAPNEECCIRQKIVGYLLR
jgi:proteic killer suppression protein